MSLLFYANKVKMQQRSWLFVSTHRPSLLKAPHPKRNFPFEKSQPIDRLRMTLYAGAVLTVRRNALGNFLQNLFRLQIFHLTRPRSIMPAAAIFKAELANMCVAGAVKD